MEIFYKYPSRLHLHINFVDLPLKTSDKVVRYTHVLDSTYYLIDNTTTDLRLPRRNSKSGQKCFSFRGDKL